MRETIARLEVELAMWQDMRWTVKDPELRKGAQQKVLEVAVELRAARAKEKAARAEGGK